MEDIFNSGAMEGIYFDILKEIGNVGAGNAVTALSDMIGGKVNMDVPVVNLLEFKEMAEVIGSPEDLVFGILVNVSGDINGMMMFLVRVDSARSMINGLLGSSDGSQQIFSEMDLSALKEIGNILSGSYLAALGTLLDKSVISSVPFLAQDMAGAILSVPAIEFGKIADKALFIESVFKSKDEDVSGYFILVPDLPSFDIILKALGVI